MEKTTKDLKNFIKFLVYGFILVILLNFLVGEALRFIRLTLIPASWCIAIIIVVAFKDQLIELIKIITGGTRNETRRNGYYRVKKYNVNRKNRNN